ncbi:response regulator [Terricaulis silvestris]|uniref:histidine kinase n=1 Tax=Terricaulis silvestris TaxID=2686094 RepID=A0A6I6MG65_9CAUL|nr:response regulator [Terricaulis silvestris]QGZ93560.1 Blue-light-activated histidine kinase [Terricaulis silvestris]
MSGDLGLAERVNILLVDDQPGKLMSYELILEDLGQNLLKANCAKQALELLLKNDVAVILVDVCMPDLDGFELAQMIREHPRFKDTAIIFISAINVTEMDSLRGYELGAVDYVPVPVVPGVLRAKVRVFVDLYVKTRALARMNGQLEQRVAERTAELEAATERQELLAREVDHRARNALAVIQSIVALTPVDDNVRFAEAIKGRVRAMATAHNLLSESRWRGANLLSLMHEELAPYSQNGRVSISGTAVSIAPAVAQNLALALHELATNAAKYGALSDIDGKLTVAWRIDGETMLMEWREDCPHAVIEPSKKGFGSKVVEASVTGQLGGRIERDWRPNGLHCRFSLPSRHFADVETGEAQQLASREGRTQKPAAGSLKDRRILVLEDEPLIAMMTSQLIRELGGVVLGPFTGVRKAADAVTVGVDAALLDVNIAGELAYPLADQLSGLGIPIIFMTGYHAGAIEPRFAGCPVLTKPVDRDELALVLTRAAGTTEMENTALVTERSPRSHA